jgi:hypothetical protein
MLERVLEAIDGNTYRVIQAKHDYAVRCYRSDRSRAIPGDLRKCLIALGAKRNRLVVDCLIGAGRNAYVLFEATEESEREWHHFNTSATSRKVADEFDKDKKTQTIIVMLKRPSKGTAKNAASSRHAKQYQERKTTGKQPNKTIGATKKTRMKRLGVPHRPMPRIKTRKLEGSDVS